MLTITKRYVHTTNILKNQPAHPPPEDHIVFADPPTSRMQTSSFSTLLHPDPAVTEAAEGKCIPVIISQGIPAELESTSDSDDELHHPKEVFDKEDGEYTGPDEEEVTQTKTLGMMIGLTCRRRSMVSSRKNW